MTWIEGALNQTVAAIRQGAELPVRQHHIDTVRQFLETSYQYVSAPQWANGHSDIVLDLAEQVGELASLSTKLAAHEANAPAPTEVEDDHLVGSLEIYASAICPTRNLPDRGRGAYCSEYHRPQPTAEMAKVWNALDSLDFISQPKRQELDIQNAQVDFVEGVQNAIASYRESG